MLFVKESWVWGNAALGSLSDGKFSVYPIKPVKDEVGIEERLSRPA